MPIHQHEDDRQWFQRPILASSFGGERNVLGRAGSYPHPGGKYFAGFRALHWAEGENVQGTLFAGYLPHVCPDKSDVSFMYSYPNLFLWTLTVSEDRSPSLSRTTCEPWMAHQGGAQRVGIAPKGENASDSVKSWDAGRTALPGSLLATTLWSALKVD